MSANPVSEQPWSRDQFEQQLRSLGNRYHIHHPFQVMMNNGELNREQIQGWVANRFYYQISIPRKDANFLANCPDRLTRQLWVQRIIDHDGTDGGEGGIEVWLRLAEATGLDRDTVLRQQMVLPGVRFAVDAYINFVRNHNWQEAACSSLTEMFAPTIHKQRISSWPDKYPWIESQGLDYFKNRIKEAHRDVEHGLSITLDYFQTREQQRRAMQILQFKLDVLWSMLDAMYMAYINEMPPYFNVADANQHEPSAL
jgi:pyrroloquinoline-quinone synthase